MFSVATPIWNRIAETQELVSPLAKRLFHLAPDELDRQLETEEKKLEAKGVSSPAIVGYLTMAPLLFEKAAIARWKQENPASTSLLPNVETPDEAVMIFSRDRPMSTSQQTELSNLLRTGLEELTGESSNA